MLAKPSWARRSRVVRFSQGEAAIMLLIQKKGEKTKARSVSFPSGCSLVHTLWLPVFLVNLLRGRARTILAEGRSPREAFSDIIIAPTHREEWLRSVSPTMRNGFRVPQITDRETLSLSAANGTNLHHGRALTTHTRARTPTDQHRLNLLRFADALRGEWRKFGNQITREATAAGRGAKLEQAIVFCLSGRQCRDFLQLGANLKLSLEHLSEIAAINRVLNKFWLLKTRSSNWSFFYLEMWKIQEQHVRIRYVSDFSCKNVLNSVLES